MGELWCVFHLKRQTQINHLTRDQLRAYLAKYRSEDLNYLFVWNEKLEDWSPLKNFPDLMVSLLEGVQSKLFQAPPPPSFTPNPILQTNPVESEDLPEPSTVQIQRKNPRFPFKQLILIRNETQSFRSYTSMISREGFGLVNGMPESFLSSPNKGDFWGVISSPDLKTKIKFHLRPLNVTSAQVLSNQNQLQLWINENIQSDGGSIKSQISGIPLKLKHRLAVP